MIALVMGAITALAIIVLCGKDYKAVKAHKEEQERLKKYQYEYKKQIEYQQKKMANDPYIRKQAIERQESMKKKLFANLSEEYKKIVEEYITKKKTGNKTEDDVLKYSMMKMGCYIFMFIFVVGIVVSIYLIAGEEGQAKMTQQVKSFIGNIYPRFKDQPAEL